MQSQRIQQQLVLGRASRKSKNMSPSPRDVTEVSPDCFANCWLVSQWQINGDASVGSRVSRGQTRPGWFKLCSFISFLDLQQVLNFISLKEPLLSEKKQSHSQGLRLHFWMALLLIENGSHWKKQSLCQQPSINVHISSLFSAYQRKQITRGCSGWVMWMWDLGAHRAGCTLSSATYELRELRAVIFTFLSLGFLICTMKKVIPSPKGCGRLNKITEKHLVQCWDIIRAQ